jgi:hypothetical protein
MAATRAATEAHAAAATEAIAEIAVAMIAVRAAAVECAGDVLDHGVRYVAFVPINR